MKNNGDGEEEKAAWAMMGEAFVRALQSSCDEDKGFYEALDASDFLYRNYLSAEQQAAFSDLCGLYYPGTKPCIDMEAANEGWEWGLGLPVVRDPATSEWRAAAANVLEFPTRPLSNQEKIAPPKPAPES
jgi:hypothetical protein